MRKSVLTATLALLAAATAAHAQGIRINGVTTARYIELRPLNTLERESSGRSPPAGKSVLRG